MDIQRFLDNYFQAKEIIFIPGTKVIQNLFSSRSDIELDKIHFFCDPIQRVQKRTLTGTLTGQKSTINFALVVCSTIDQPYMNETVTSNVDTKYTKNIEPLIIQWNQIVKDLGCSFDISNESFTDIVNIKDVNFDGIIGQITLESYV
jgi:hypothetical protein